MNERFINKLPNKEGYFGEYGGSFIPENLERIMQEINEEYQKAIQDESFIQELHYLYKHYVGRPSPIYHAKTLSEKYGADIYFKREDLNHTGAHKINHCLGEALLAKRMGKKKIIAETGAGQHGVALATSAALLDLECDIYMGAVDIQKEYPNVIRMKVLGARVIPVTSGLKTLKDAVDKAFEEYLKDTETQFYAIGSVVGPHPFPRMVRDFQTIIGYEAKEQFQSMTGALPQHLVACVGGGSNAIGLFTAFLDDPLSIYGVEPSGLNLDVDGKHAATLTKGTPGIMHGFKSYMLQNGLGEPLEVYSIASGLDYPSVGPEHSYLKDIKKVQYKHINDKEAIEAFFEIAKLEGIIPAIESAHAIAYSFKLAKEKKGESILVNLSGRGDKDIDFIVKNYGQDFGVNMDEYKL